MAKEQVFVIEADGETVTALYSDGLADLGTVLEVSRASNVEWGLVAGSRGWDVILTDDPRNSAYAGLVVLAADIAVSATEARELAAAGQYQGFQSRAEALDVEVAYLNLNILGVCA